MKKWLRQFTSEDWIIVIAGAVILALAAAFPSSMPQMPKTIGTADSWLSALYMFVFILILTYTTSAALRRPLRGIFLSLLVIFLLTFGAQLLAAVPFFKELGLEPVFFSVILGLLISNTIGVPQWMKAAIQSEFYIKIGIICLGSTILFKEVLESGAYGLAQSLIVVFTVWYFAFWLCRRMKIDPEMGTMLSGDNKKLSYVISLVLIIAIPMMYLLPWLSRVMGLNEEVAGAWLGGTIDTTGAVAASGTLIGETAAKTAVIVKSSQNVLLGVAAFIISLLWSYRGTPSGQQEKVTAKVIWDRFPKFVVGFILASIVFSFCMDEATAKTVGTVTKGFQNTLFSIAFVCIGLETRFKDIFGKENRRPLYAFLIAQGFNIVVTLLVALLMFGLLKPML